MANDNDLRREKQRKMMLEDPLGKVILIVAVPMIFSMLIDAIYSMADTYFVSQLGTVATAAVGVNDSLLQYIRAIAMGFGVGACSYISRLLGANEDEESNKVATTTLFTAVGGLSLVALIAFIFKEPMVMALGAKSDGVKFYAMEYAQFILISAPFTAGEVVFSQLLRSEGNTKYAMIGALSGCTLNIALDPIFISVLGLGVAGAAIATTIAKMVSFTILLIPFLKRRTMLRIKVKYFTPKLQIYSEVAKMGIPTFLRSALMASSFAVLNNVAGGFSDSALAAVSVSKKSTSFVASAIMGFGQGFQPVAGFCWGAKKYERVRESFWVCTKIGWIAAVVLGLTMGIFSPQLISIFNNSNDAEVARLGVLMIRSQCLALIPHVWGVVVNGLCQAVGRPLFSTLVGLARNFLCLIPSILVLSTVFGVNGLAVSQGAADMLSLIIVIPIVVVLTRETNKRIQEQKSEAEITS